MALRLVFMGTADLSCTILQALVACPDYTVTAVVTQPDRPSGRHLRLQASPVKHLALELKLPVLQPERARDEKFLLALGQLNPELIVVAAYGQILSPAVLELPPRSCLNVHTSLLPKYRGAAPIQAAILNDESVTGVTIMKMDAGLDAGPVLARAETKIEETDTSETLHERLGHLGATLLRDTIPRWVAGQIHESPQPEVGVSYAPRIKKEDGHLDWNQPARTLWNRVRALIPWPGAFCFLPGEPKARLKIWQAECLAAMSGPPGEVIRADREGIVVATSAGALRLLVVQKEGGRRVSPAEFLSGHSLMRGTRLS